jgi:hypothetical protein
VVARPPSLYCVCGTTLLDPDGLAVTQAFTCQKCEIGRCAPCMWKHFREKHPSQFLSLRNQVLLGTLTQDFRVVSP